MAEDYTPDSEGEAKDPLAGFSEEQQKTLRALAAEYGVNPLNTQVFGEDERAELERYLQDYCPADSQSMREVVAIAEEELKAPRGLQALQVRLQERLQKFGRRVKIGYGKVGDKIIEKYTYIVVPGVGMVMGGAIGAPAGTGGMLIGALLGGVGMGGGVTWMVAREEKASQPPSEPPQE